MRYLQSLLSRHSWLMVICAGSVLRLWQINQTTGWYDEIVSLVMASAPLANLIAATAGDVHPPLWYLVVWGAVHLTGISQIWIIRLPSVLCSVLTLLAVRPVMQQLGLSPRAVLIGTVLLALAPFELWYAREARMYALLELLFVLGLWASLSRRWVLVGLICAAMLWTHNYGGIYSAVVLALGLTRIRQRLELLWIGLAGVVAAVAYVPWLIVLLGQLSAMRAGWWQIATTPGAAVVTLYELVFSHGLPDSFVPMGAIAVYMLTCSALWSAVRARQSGPLLLAIGLLAAPAAALLLEQLYRPIWLTRAMIGSAVLLKLLLAWHLDTMSDISRRMLYLLLGPLFLFSALWTYPAEHYAKAARFAGDEIVDQLQPGDQIIHVNSGTWVGYWPITHGDPRWPAQCILPQLPGTLGNLSDQTLAALGAPICAPDLDWRRAWLVWGAGPTVTELEDAEVAGLLERYAHQTIYTWPENERTQDGGIWLLTR